MNHPNKAWTAVAPASQLGLDFLQDASKCRDLFLEIKAWHNERKPAPKDLTESYQKAYQKASDSFGRLVGTLTLLYILALIILVAFYA